MSDTTLTLTPGTGGGHVVTLTPPQTVANGIQVGKGAYCFVIDISGRFVASCALGGPRGWAAHGQLDRLLGWYRLAPATQHERRRGNHNRGR